MKNTATERLEQHFQIHHLFLVWAFLMGSLVRFLPILRGDFPLGDGGLFYVMSRELLANHFSLPIFTAFNQEQIPFAYPPLGFYLTALVSFAGNIPMLILFQWLPSFLCILTIPAFYFLAREFLDSRFKASLAALAYAMLPVTYEWQVMGGGIERSLGLIFSLAFCFSYFGFLRRNSWKWGILCTVCMGLLILSHPTWTYQTLIFITLYALLLIRRWKTLIQSALILWGGILIAAPWWATVVLRHGAAPFLSAFQTGGGGSLSDWAPLLSMNFSAEPFLGILIVLALLGCTVCLSQRQYLFPLWVLVPFLVTNRNAGAFTAAPLAMMASIGIADLLFPAFLLLEKRKDALDALHAVPVAEEKWKTIFLQSRVIKGFVLFLLTYTLINAYHFSQLLEYQKLSPEDTRALQWVADNTARESRFLILGEGNVFSMPLSEWFPAITGRRNIALAQGYEWIDGPQYAVRLARDNALQECLWKTDACLRDWLLAKGEDADYVWIHVWPYGYSGEDPLPGGGWLAFSMQQSGAYQTVFETSGNIILRHLPGK
jgi:hypothetical protein